ncbi:mannose-1-phosphate guanylyltransferase/mannose-6-phosphate isomerase [Escherichia coli]|uniref:mannose-1-phosphate guanylyltransferase/mannose-6-phosphate isomerase n=1 Tax=Escherichia coli TaxID=562 RepID=UPI0011C9E9CF|nr:mannose-1-phosphate guanylyltransferase/mannose-6-phosphate isomerase [Escherichia coli]
MIIPIIMAGGSGTRLWPLSRSLYPKQFLSLINENSLLQETLKRLDGLNCLPPVIVSNNEHRFIVAEQLRQFGVDASQIILDPVGKNPAPAVALAALKSLELHGDHHMLVLAADHAIQDIEAFHAAVLAAEQESVDNKLVTFGIVPTKPETGYGYIKKGEQVKNSVFKVNSFVEKPDLETAKNYLEQKCYLWNSGMFMFKASVYLDELKKFRPDILAACKESLSSASTDLDFIRLNSDVFAECPDESIDYAVMEKTQDCVVIPLDADWSDIGSWTSLWEISEKDEHENVSHGDVINYNSRNNYIYSEGSLISTVGVNNLIIVQTKDALLVAQQDNVQDIKKIVEILKKQKRSEHISHREVYRPWGRYDSVERGDRYQVKRITVKPGECLSTQMHHHRAEHWVVVAGTAKVTCGERTFFVTENESTFIPIGTVHTLENPGKIPLEVIEIQSGVYLGDDDIVRLSDKYGRVEDK